MISIEELNRQLGKNKVSIEVSANPDGGICLSYWDVIHGNDVIASMDEEGIVLIEFQDGSDEEIRIPLDGLADYMRRVAESAKKAEDSRWAT